jgi:hypothetical protein
MNAESPRGSAFRAWWVLVGLSFRRVGWSLQTLATLAILVLVGLLIAAWAMFTAQQGRPGWNFVNFSQNILGGIYLSFILPLICLCFGTQALGGDWEEKSLVWLLTRPLPRPAIYLAKYVAALPWTLGLAVGGLFFLGAMTGPVNEPVTPLATARTMSENVVAASVDPPDLEATSTLPMGWPGLECAKAFWPVAAWGTLAYLGLFQLFGCWFRRSTIIGVTYTFVLEIIVANMPGLLKRGSIAFYNRCMMYGIAQKNDWDTVRGQPALAPPRDAFFQHVSYDTAFQMLLIFTLSLLMLGAWMFTRREYKDLT